MIIAIVITITPIQANNYNNVAVAGGLAAGIALLVMATNSANYTPEVESPNKS